MKKRSVQPITVAEDLVGRLSELGEITHRRMFGGVGIFCDQKMFALVTSSGVPFLKTNDDSKSNFEALEAERFGKMPYHEIPETVLGNNAKLKKWARRSIEISQQ